MMLLNPKQERYDFLDEESKQIMLKTIEFFEKKGKRKLKQDFHERIWYSDFLDFVKEEKIFSRLLTPSKYGSGNERWDTYRICFFNEILGFYGLCYWYTWQVSILGLGPIWMSDNEEIKVKTANLLKEGAVFAFGLSEKEHGADLYSSEMMLYPQENGTYLAKGSKYYIGNANKAALVSTFGKMADSGNYVFFAVDSQHKNFECIQNVVNNQSYVAEYALHDYPITEADILSKNQDAWDTSLNTVNVGKYNLGWASIGICTHAFYEALDHASNRRLFNHYVTDFPHIRQFFMDAYTRIVAMKLFALRNSDYLRAASSTDRRYLLYNPMTKMKVTTQGEEVINLLWDIIAAKGFEKNMYFEMAAIDIRALPKLEGTVHVNMALIIKFMANYFFVPDANFPVISKMDGLTNDDFLFAQGPTKGLSKIRFHDYKIAYNSLDLPNIKTFKEQIDIFKEFLLKATPNSEQQKDIDFLLTIGELFTLVAYGQLIIENATIRNVDIDLIDQIFDFMIRDFSKFALQLYSKSSSTEDQMEFALKMIRKPKLNVERFSRIWDKYLFPLKGSYQMNE
ncbi:MAG: acyl-CoA dehydrogenase [Desulfobacterales bacterium]|nr:acyl-CoA dehydrogenase [Desulfobacterales bacterium]